MMEVRYLSRYDFFNARFVWGVIAILSCLISLKALAQGSLADNEAEQQVRAQFVYNFANFVEWPMEAFDKQDAPIKVCLFGEVHFSPYLYNFDGVAIGPRKLLIKRAKKMDEIRSGCHILYVGDDERVRLPTFWKQIKYTYVLSVGERNGFADKGGIINIMSTRDRLQFDVNIENALINGLFLDSDLLSLARVIKRNTKRNNKTSAPTE